MLQTTDALATQQPTTDLPEAQAAQPRLGSLLDTVQKQKLIFWRQPGLILGGVTLLVVLVVLWLGLRWFNGLFSGMNDVLPTATVTPTTDVALADQIPTPDETATTADPSTPPPALTKRPLSLATSTLKTGATQTNPKDGAVYVWIPPGEFTMGSGDDDEQADDAERPEHTVEMAGFWLMRLEVTNEQYQRCVEEGVCTAPESDRWRETPYAQHPVVGVDWNQANLYAAWAGGRLPTEAEWEKACRGGDDRLYPWGDEAPNLERLNTYESGQGDTMPVGSYPPGAYGLADMAGNVWEWTSSLYWAYPYQADDGREEPAGDGFRTVRGGSFNYLESSVRCVARDSYEPTYRNDYIGFRVLFPYR